MELTMMSLAIDDQERIEGAGPDYSLGSTLGGTFGALGLGSWAGVTAAGASGATAYTILGAAAMGATVGLGIGIVVGIGIAAAVYYW